MLDMGKMGNGNESIMIVRCGNRLILGKIQLLHNTPRCPVMALSFSFLISVDYNVVLIACRARIIAELEQTRLLGVIS